MAGSVMTSGLPAVRLDVHQGGRSVPYFFDQVDFLVGTVAGCDSRVPGANLPVLCLDDIRTDSQFDGSRQRSCCSSMEPR